MFNLCVLIWALSFQGAAAGDDLSDFSNNLAQDLGPLIALFGEPITRQYLSESTTFLDYFIFAVCPLGIITAIVSVIRVCGHSSLRAFIGRSQEGNGVVEAELCTSYKSRCVRAIQSRRHHPRPWPAKYTRACVHFPQDAKDNIGI